MTAPELYDTIGRSYTNTRRPDPRIAAAIWEALGDARTVLNVGAGAGAYEPAGREVVALEPSPVMIAQRPPGAAPVMRGHAEDLPFDDGAFDAVMAVLSDHHWSDRPRGFQELRRVASERVVLFNANPAEADLFWLTTEYLPEFLDVIPAQYRQPGAWESELRAALGPSTSCRCRSLTIAWTGSTLRSGAGPRPILIRECEPASPCLRR